MSKTKNIRRILRYMNGFKGLVILSFVLACAYAALSMLIPFYSGKTIDLIDSNVSDNMQSILNGVLLIAIIASIGALSQFVMLRINNRLSYDLITRLKNEAYGKIRRLPISYIDRSESGSIQSLVINDCRGFINNFQ